MLSAGALAWKVALHVQVLLVACTHVTFWTLTVSSEGAPAVPVIDVGISLVTKFCTALVSTPPLPGLRATATMTTITAIWAATRPVHTHFAFPEIRVEYQVKIREKTPRKSHVTKIPPLPSPRGGFSAVGGTGASGA
jgi:hypothetical protein